MSHNETLNTWDAENLVGEELTDDELAAAQGGNFVPPIYVNVPITTQIDIQVAAGNFNSQIFQFANQHAK